jgi:hypothetical protein
MPHSAEAKLHELRDKTERQLVLLINNRLDRGLAFARMLDCEGADWESTEDFAANAEKALADAIAWMPLLTSVKTLERRRLESRLTQLRDALNRANQRELRVQAAC